MGRQGTRALAAQERASGACSEGLLADSSHKLTWLERGFSDPQGQAVGRQPSWAHLPGAAVSRIRRTGPGPTVITEAHLVALEAA